MRSDCCFAVLLLAAGACDGDPARDAAGRTVTETRGDTLIVRSVGAGDIAPATLTSELSIGVLEGDPQYMFGRLAALAVEEDGSIYTYDDRPPELRKYDADGRYVATFGRTGRGPGELRQVTGIAARSGGGLVVWDPGNTRLTAMDDSGTVLRETQIPSSLFSPNALVVDTAGHAYVQIIVQWQGNAFVTGLAHYDENGELVDTVRTPDWGYVQPQLGAQSPDGRGRSSSPVPFAPGTPWVMTRTGEVASGLASSYRIDVAKKDGTVLRIEKEADPVPVPAEERSARREQLTQTMQRTQPGWRWSGPDVFDVKPFFQNLHGGIDGSLWVHLHAPSTRLPADTAAPAAPARFAEPVIFDVFAQGGDWLGRVVRPERTRFLVYSADRIWAVVRDSLDVESIVRFRIDWPSR